jgi:hypothetical protein
MGICGIILKLNGENIPFFLTPAARHIVVNVNEFSKYIDIIVRISYRYPDVKELRNGKVENHPIYVLKSLIP